MYIGTKTEGVCLRGHKKSFLISILLAATKSFLTTPSFWILLGDTLVLLFILLTLTSPHIGKYLLPRLVARKVLEECGPSMLTTKNIEILTETLKLYGDKIYSKIRLEPLLLMPPNNDFAKNFNKTYLARVSKVDILNIATISINIHQRKNIKEITEKAIQNIRLARI